MSSGAPTSRHLLPALPERRGVIPPSDLVLTADTLGAGRFGTVLRAEWLHSSVACKRIVPASEITGDVREHLEREVSALIALLAHPNVLPLYGITEGPGGSVFLVSKLCAGGSLKTRVRSLREAGAVVPAAEFFHVARSVVSGLAFLHTHGLVYRDLKSGNVLLGADRERGTVQIDTEFGVVKYLLDEIAALHTRTSPKTGHSLDVAYLAPELLLVGSAGARAVASADMYSVALVLYEMATGWPPFRGLGMPDVLKAVIGRLRPPLPPSLPAPVADLIRELWADDPADRPTARDLLEKLCCLEAQLARDGPPWAAAAAAAADVTLSVPAISIATGAAVPPQPESPPARKAFSLAAFAAAP